MRHKGPLYRAINPKYATDPLSGEGARLYGGRFNPKGMAALYTSLTPETAIKEANQIGSFQPVTLVCYEAEIDAVLDGRDPRALSSVGVGAADLADPTWRNRMKKSGEAPTQALARRLVAAGYSGLLVPSFAPRATDDDVNLVLWTWGDAPPARPPAGRR